MIQNYLTSITTSSAGTHTLRVIIVGHLDLCVGFELLRLSAVDEGIFANFEFDFGRRPVIRDSGLAWLLMFCRLASARGQVVKITNMETTTAQRVMSNGLPPNFEIENCREHRRLPVPDRVAVPKTNWHFSAA